MSGETLEQKIRGGGNGVARVLSPKILQIYKKGKKQKWTTYWQWSPQIFETSAASVRNIYVAMVICHLQYKV